MMTPGHMGFLCPPSALSSHCTSWQTQLSPAQSCQNSSHPWIYVPLILLWAPGHTPQTFPDKNKLLPSALEPWLSWPVSAEADASSLPRPGTSLGTEFTSEGTGSPHDPTPLPTCQQAPLFCSRQDSLQKSGVKM